MSAAEGAPHSKTELPPHQLLAEVQREDLMTRNRKKRERYFTVYTPPSSGPAPQLPAPPELVRAGAVTREERFLRGDYDHFEDEAIKRALGRLAVGTADEAEAGVS
jgi:hypothetical protein